MKKTTILVIAPLLIGWALGAAPKYTAPALPPATPGVVTIQLSTGTAQELLLAISGALNPTAPIAIPDNPACRTKQ